MEESELEDFEGFYNNMKLRDAKGDSVVGHCKSCGGPVMGKLTFSWEPDIPTCDCHTTKGKIKRLFQWKKKSK